MTTVRRSDGNYPPSFIEIDGKMTHVTWVDVSTFGDIAKGERVYCVGVQDWVPSDVIKAPEADA